MKNLSLCLFVLGLAVIGCDKPKPPPAPPIMPNPAAMGSHAGMKNPAAATEEKKEEAAPAAAEEKKEEAAAEEKKAEEKPEEKKE